MSFYRFPAYTNTYDTYPIYMEFSPYREVDNHNKYIVYQYPDRVMNFNLGSFRDNKTSNTIFGGYSDIHRHYENIKNQYANVERQYAIAQREYANIKHKFGNIQKKYENIRQEYEYGRQQYEKARQDHDKTVLHCTQHHLSEKHSNPLFHYPQQHQYKKHENSATFSQPLQYRHKNHDNTVLHHPKNEQCKKYHNKKHIFDVNTMLKDYILQFLPETNLTEQPVNVAGEVGRPVNIANKIEQPVNIANKIEQPVNIVGNINKIEQPVNIVGNINKIEQPVNVANKIEQPVNRVYKVKKFAKNPSKTCRKRQKNIHENNDKPVYVTTKCDNTHNSDIPCRGKEILKDIFVNDTRKKLVDNMGQSDIISETNEWINNNNNNNNDIKNNKNNDIKNINNNDNKNNDIKNINNIQNNNNIQDVTEKYDSRYGYFLDEYDVLDNSKNKSSFVI
jgi:hypothetical protein